nr:4-carboxymuconolactone decarboxylase [Actinomycetota bacterium]
CTAARFGDEAMWRERAELVRASGTSTMVEGSAQRWFRPGFIDEEPDAAATLLNSLRDADPAGYAAVCDALATFDVRHELSRIDVPVFAVAGAYDVAAPVAAMAELAHGVADGRLVVLDRVGHLAPAEAPADTARAIREAAGLGQGDAAPGPVRDRVAAGMAVRRAVLGEEHVDRATAAATDLTREFQEFITDYVWGGIWTRPGLDRRSRSMITLTALIARGHHEELAMHLRAAHTNGLSDDEIKEVILQSAIYCGVPDANTAFRIAQRTLDEVDRRDAR